MQLSLNLINSEAIFMSPRETLLNSCSFLFFGNTFLISCDFWFFWPGTGSRHLSQARRQQGLSLCPTAVLPWIIKFCLSNSYWFLMCHLILGSYFMWAIHVRTAHDLAISSRFVLCYTLWSTVAVAQFASFASHWGARENSACCPRVQKTSKSKKVWKALETLHMWSLWNICSDCSEALWCLSRFLLASGDAQIVVH